jgi:hypothetical protein
MLEKNYLKLDKLQFDIRKYDLAEKLKTPSLVLNGTFS